MVMSRRNVGIANISSKTREMTGPPSRRRNRRSPQKHANDEGDAHRHKTNRQRIARTVHDSRHDVPP